MAPAVSTTPDPRGSEAEVLGSLLRLYEDEKQIYGQVLDLSRRQGEALRRGASLREIMGLLETKRNCLDTVRRLESTRARQKRTWELGRGSWSVAARARLNVALRTVARIIEEILACEENNDLILLEQTREL